MENIDLKISNYLNILSNQELKMNLDENTIDLLVRSVKIYALTTAKNYIEEYIKQKEEEKTNKEFDSYIDNLHPKLEPIEPIETKTF